MNLLRAKVRRKGEWWEIELLDLGVVADGASETAMLRELEYTLTAEYHLALQANQTPFVKLLKGVPVEVTDSWNDGNKSLRTLNLPDEVKQALAAVFHVRSLNPFRIYEDVIAA